MVTGRRIATGFTLIEVLISTVLLSLLMLSASALYNYVSQNWQRNQHRYHKVVDSYKSWTLVQQSLHNTYPKLVYQARPDKNRKKNQFPGFYFLGRDNGFTAITLQSVQQPGHSAVYRLFREPDPQDQTRWQLVYEEALLDQVILQHAEQELPFNFRRILVADLAELNFYYKGWPSLDAKLKYISEFEVADYKGDWVPFYDGMQTLQHPLEIKISAQSFEWSVVIADEKTRAQSSLEPEL
jgi:prepilin-type N-terminal cleavage/methylation domain-containing protein